MGADRAKRKQRGGSVLGMDWEDNTRQKIQASQITNRLISFVEGEITLEPAQVTAAGLLLRKVLPDLASTEATVKHSGGIEVRASKEQRDAAVSAALRANTDA